MLNPAQAIRVAWQNKFDFKGRASRSEYWWTAIILSFLFSAIEYIDDLIFPYGMFGNLDGNYVTTGWIGFLNDLNAYPIYNVLYFLLLIPLTFQAIRRLHDTGRRGWLAVLVACLLVIMTYVPMTVFQSLHLGLLLGNGAWNFSDLPRIDYVVLLCWLVMGFLWIWQFILNVLPSQKEQNRYGANPIELKVSDVFS